MPVSRATATGGLAILLWSSLAALAVVTRRLPPFETLALSFAIAFAAGLVMLAARRRLARLRQDWRAWALGFAGIFAYHAFYFIALDQAPAAEASLINYLWPLLIVLFSALLPGERLRARHVAGATIGLTGTALIVLAGVGAAGRGSALGYACAFAAALTWAAYSVANRRLRAVPSDLIAGVSGLVALAAALVHLAVEPSIAPRGGEWMALLGLGLGPVGLAFFFWDHATKHGDLAALGTLSYATPLLSTGLLIVCGEARAGAALVLAAALIVGGAAVSVGLPRFIPPAASNPSR
nr:DMT family transporter [Acidibrevibacterium fodinaquatile]